MNAIATQLPNTALLPASPSFVTQVSILLARLLRQLVVSPTTYINLAISLFFLAVYTGAFGASPGFEKLIGASFLTFILPVSIVNARPRIPSSRTMAAPVPTGAASHLCGSMANESISATSP